jgi:NAD(P)-dependent dehydrogenase (short-subunit alcohol dehydrogenase family)
MLDEQFPSFSLSGQVVLVTGAARGIGHAAALACAHAGADLVLGLHDIATDGGLEAKIAALGRRVIRVQMDVTRKDQIEEAVVRAEAAFGRIDVLVNNVGLGPENLAENVTEADFDLTVGVNLKGTFFVTQTVGRRMIARRFGRVVNLSSQAGSVPLKGESIYCMTKAAIDHLTRCLAMEWGPYNITVNAVAPTYIWTESNRVLLSNAMFHAQAVAHIPLGRIGQTADVVGAIVFFASPAASFITGTTLLVDGGFCVA